MGITQAADLRESLRMSCIPESMLDGVIRESDDFLERRRRPMVLEMKNWFEVR